MEEKDYIDEVYEHSTKLAKHSYNAITGHIANLTEADHKQTLEMLTMLSRVIEAQQTAIRELYTILVEAE